jgi:hypothetical protein
MTMTDKEDQDPFVGMRFIVTIEGNLTDKGTLMAEAFQLDADGNVLLETSPVKSETNENLLVSLFEGGTFLQSLSLSIGRKIALSSGDIATAVGLQRIANRLEVPIGG